MIEKTVYVANDGKEFDDEDECVEYEAQTEFSDILQSITFYSEQGEVISFDNDINSFQIALDDANFILIPSYLRDKRIEYFNNKVMRELCGKEFPTATGLYRWNWDNEEWISFTTETQQFAEKWNKMLDISINAERR